jgi:hypothetical protein
MPEFQIPYSSVGDVTASLKTTYFFALFPRETEAYCNESVNTTIMDPVRNG